MSTTTLWQFQCQKEGTLFYYSSSDRPHDELVTYCPVCDSNNVRQTGRFWTDFNDQVTGSSLLATNSVLQPWVMKLGLRHQGALVGAIRGCDGVPKDDPSKGVVRCLRAAIMVPFTPNPKSYMDFRSREELLGRMQSMLDSLDHYPLHFVQHLLMAVQIVGYKRPSQDGEAGSLHRHVWRNFYSNICATLHVNIESEEQMDQRYNRKERV